jgi:hypothetical protein
MYNNLQRVPIIQELMEDYLVWIYSEFIVYLLLLYNKFLFIWDFIVYLIQIYSEFPLSKN